MGRNLGKAPEHSTRKAVTPHVERGGRIAVETHDATKDMPRSMPQRRQGPEHD